MSESEIIARKAQAIAQIDFHDLDEQTLSPLPYERLQDIYEDIYTRNEDGGVDDGIGYGALAAKTFDLADLDQQGLPVNPVDIDKLRMTGRYIGTVLKFEEQQAKNSIDPLTGLLKREAFMETLQERMKAGKSFSVLMIDIDNFKELNEVLGHRGGDVELNSVGEFIVHALKMARSKKMKGDNNPRILARDDATRTSGDEYIAAIDEVEGIDPEDARDAIVKTLMETYDNHVTTRYNNVLSIGLSVGWATYDPDTHTRPEDIVHDADIHMLSLKEANHARLGYTHRPITDHDRPDEK